MHTEAGLTFQEAAQYTAQELARLQLGWMIRERDDYTGGRSSAETQKRKIKRGQQRAREDMYQDLGIH